MHAFQVFSLLLASSFVLVAANPLLTSLTERRTCNCDSPTGCPGRCTPLQGSGTGWCINYCSWGNAVMCGACGQSYTLGCIVNDDGSCFTVVTTRGDYSLRIYHYSPECHPANTILRPRTQYIFFVNYEVRAEI
ncbi:hypothetical protein DFH08DRAFT_817914 [Mycena albidolilacea]|uniref:Uncharacterized protein n=1 Tax=Mycena albidolilacea TaxID=1033008 RepID=A0AAD7EGS8_9AGAR|nr:hypothetical protein DFH08DRAFT_817914 [Mycena albidolilacea]